MQLVLDLAKLGVDALTVDADAFILRDAWSYIKRYPRAFDAIVDALEQGKSAAECMQAAEAAEEARDAAEAEAAAAKAQAVAKETPQQRAAREREEMAARGKR